MAKILISGGNGFIGAHLVAKLKRLKHQVYILDENKLYFNINDDFKKK
jgi:nucleoside-diphosphate-sugar epimerase